MQILNLFQRHRRFGLLATAYVDGELPAADRKRFEAHVSGCRECTAAVEAARALKAAISSLPAVPVTRSFSITPAMVAASAQPALAAVPARLPLYLVGARIAAGLAVVAFVSVFAVSVLGGSSHDQQATSEQLSSGAGMPLSDRANGAEAAPGAAGKSADATPVQSLAPSSGGGVGSQAFASPVAPSPAPPERSAVDSAATAAGPPGISPTEGHPGVLADAATSAEDTDEDESSTGGVPWVIVIGSFAGAAVGLLYVLEVNRRKRA